METQTSEFSKLVRTKRKAEGMTQAELAQTAGVGVRFVRELEAGKPTLRIDKINQVLWLFGYEAGPVALPESEESEHEES
ncbi:MAG: helix-turn-helix transcriptional regulator [Saprospiraceae bacterium]